MVLPCMFTCVYPVAINLSDFSEILRSTMLIYVAIQYRSNATSHTHACTGLPAHVCKHVLLCVMECSRVSFTAHLCYTRGCTYACVT